jgi:rubrerythrin
MDVFAFAMKMEQDGKTYYLKLAAGTAISGLKTIFTMLAEDEQKHYDSILSMKDCSVANDIADSTALEKAQNVLAQLIADKNTITTMAEDLDGYIHAMKIEADSVRFYESAAEKEKDEKAKRLLLQIAEEEKKHYNIVENIYEFVLKPKYFLAWGEFSNLKEF